MQIFTEIRFTKDIHTYQKNILTFRVTQGWKKNDGGSSPSLAGSYYAWGEFQRP